MLRSGEGPGRAHVLRWEPPPDDQSRTDCDGAHTQDDGNEQEYLRTRRSARDPRRVSGRSHSRRLGGVVEQRHLVAGLHVRCRGPRDVAHLDAITAADVERDLVGAARLATASVHTNDGGCSCLAVRLEPRLGAVESTNRAHGQRSDNEDDRDRDAARSPGPPPSVRARCPSAHPCSLLTDPRVPSTSGVRPATRLAQNAGSLMGRPLIARDSPPADPIATTPGK